LGASFAEYLFNFLDYLIRINIVLAIFNLLPVPPLDGSKILTGLLPERQMNIVFALERYGFVVLIALMWFGWLGSIISPVVMVVYDGIMSLINGIFRIVAF
jgi:Zn-dependent protease